MCIGESGEARRAGARPQGALNLGVTPPGGRTGSGLLGNLHSWTMVARLPEGTLLLLESGPTGSRFLVLSPYLGDARGPLSASYHGGPGLASPILVENEMARPISASTLHSPPGECRNPGRGEMKQGCHVAVQGEGA